MMKTKSKKPACLKPKKVFLIIVLAIIFLIVVTAIIYPFWPLIKYYLNPPDPEAFLEQSVLPSEEIPTEVGTPSDSGGAEEEISPSEEIIGNLLIIPKIGVHIPITEGEDESALDKGAWRMPETSTPDQGSNTVLAGHRWKYRPPSERTFYLLDKLQIGDVFQIFWEGEEYRYRVFSIEIVEPTALEVLDPTPNPVVTILTCTPLFSTKQRLIVRGELID